MLMFVLLFRVNVSFVEPSDSGKLRSILKESLGVWEWFVVTEIW